MNVGLCVAKGGMDRCCCQDLSAVTDGHCTDEASKTLENGDVVNHCMSVCMWVNESESVLYVCVCAHIGVSQAARCQP